MLIDWQNLFAIIRSFLKGSANLNHKLKKTTAAILAALILSSAATGVTAVLSSTQTVAHAATAVPTFTVKTPSTWNNYYTLDFTYANSAYIDAVSKITVGDTELSKASSSYSVTGNTYYTRSSDGQLCISPDAIKSGDTITVTATGYEELVLKVSGSSGSFTFEKVASGNTGGGSDNTGGSENGSGENNGSSEAKDAPSFTSTFVDGLLGSYYNISFGYSNSGYINAITKISVNGTALTKVTTTSSLKNNTYYPYESEGALRLSDTAVKSGDTITISATEYKDLVLKVSGTTGNLTFEKVESGNSGGSESGGESGGSGAGGEVTPAKDIAFAAKIESPYQILTVANDTNYVGKIKEIRVNGTAWTKAGAKISVFNENYFCDTDSSQIYFYGSALTNGDIVKIVSEGYEDKLLRVTNKDGTFSVADYEGEEANTMQLHVRLVGSFEAAILEQQKYDGISGASNSASTNKNSNVVVQAALMEGDAEPTEDDWVLLKDLGLSVNKEKTSVQIVNADGESNSGMVGFYSSYDSSLTLQGIPTTVGTYNISITYTDKQGRTATSNTLPFKVYDPEQTTLADRLTYDNCTETADGKYMWDMEPWVITKFTNNDQTFTVPEKVKAWYGSHTSGTYGELGYAVDEGAATTQTLVIPSGCNLTIVNTKILSSVKIVVENGGTLVLRDSVAYGQIEVQNGGTFSMNYDNYSGKFLTGASLCGQLILKDGATLSSSLIYSNTNFLSDGKNARHNVDPVVLAEGNVTVTGQVFIRGDEAPTGTDASTGKSYSGQPALKVQNGTLTLADNATLATYGGGKDATTSVGGSAIVLDNGAIIGNGKLIAVGGSGWSDDGGTAVTGNGRISVTDAYLEGGRTANKNAAPGAAMKSTVTLANTTNRNLINGKVLETTDSSINSDAYWRDITTVPNLNLYPVEKNAPGDNNGNNGGSGNSGNSGNTNHSGNSGTSGDTITSNTTTNPETGTTTETTTVTRPDGTSSETTTTVKPAEETKTEQVIEKDASGQVTKETTTTSSTKENDQSKTIVEKKATENSIGTSIQQTTTTVTNASGDTKSITEEYAIENIGNKTDAVLTIEKSGTGKAKNVVATVEKTGVTKGAAVQATITNKVVSQLTEAAGDHADAMKLQINVTDENGNPKYNITVDRSALQPNTSLTIYKETKTGELVMVNENAYSVDKNGNLKLLIRSNNNFHLLSAEQNKQEEARIKATIAPTSSKKTMRENTSVRFTLQNTLSKANVETITYSTSNAAVATVDKDGNIIAQKSGPATIYATIHLKNGSTKTVPMQITVK